MRCLISCLLVLALAAITQIGCSSGDGTKAASSRGVPIVDLEASEVEIVILDAKTVKVNNKKIALAGLAKELDALKMTDTAAITVEAPLSIPMTGVLNELRRRGCTNVKTVAK